MSKKPANKKNNVIKNEKPSSSLGKILFLFAILAGLASFYVYKELTTPPELPELDLDYWWGPYPVDPKPDTSIRPYKVEFSDVIVNDLRERLLHRHPFTPPLENSGSTYGFDTNFLTQVLDYWQNKYNFKEREQFFNKYNHYITNIQGLDIHYVHVKPKPITDTEIIPILLLHGWPGSIREFYEMIPKLTTPRPEYNFMFELIIPSLPGFGFSQAAVRPGLGPAQMAVIFRNLMKRIGHERYYIQGGDWGHVIGSHMATLFPQHVLGLHTNMPQVIANPLATLYILLGSLWPSLIVEPGLEGRLYPLSKTLSFLISESGYFHLAATKPDTVGVGLTDSPAGLVAYWFEKISIGTNPENKQASDGNLLVKFSLTHLLDNMMVYWVTSSITTSMRIYAEALSEKQMALKLDQIPTTVPTWGIKFKHEILYQPDSVLKLKYHNYIHTTVVDDGGHFAALENPDIMANDVFEAVKTFREYHGVGPKSQEKPLVSHDTATTIYDFTVKDIHGNNIKLDKYKGYVVVIVNVASECGLTDVNYKQLNELYEKYKSRGLRILAFPCNQFGDQEPGNARDILAFTKKRGVGFDVFEKVEVNGENAHPLWKFLKRTQRGTLGDFIKWNFSKFIVDRSGVPVERLAPTVDPLDLETYLAKYW